MNPVLETTRGVVEESKWVKIEKGAIERFCDGLELRRIPHWMESCPIDISGLDKKGKILFSFVFASVNFSYWGEPKWEVEYRGEKYDGAWAMVACLIKAMEEGIPILDADYLKDIAEWELARFLMGNIQIPLFMERLLILRDVGRALSEKYSDTLGKVFEGSYLDVVEALRVITYFFSSFDDNAFYRGKKVVFHKRAQLFLWDLHNILDGGLAGIDDLAAFADYKIPQVLRKHGILVYHPDLARRVNAKIMIDAGSEEEIEIRASMIWAVEIIKGELRKQGLNITSPEIDSWLWLQGQNKSPDNKPYHRTRTIFY